MEAKEISEEKLIKVSYGILWVVLPAMVAIGVWVGVIQNSVANVAEKIDVLHSIDVRLATIEGILQEMRR